MALSIKDEETDRLARELANVTGKSLTTAIRHALAEQLKREKRVRPGRSLLNDLNEIAERCAARPTIDDRSADEIIGYDDNGMPG